MSRFLLHSLTLVILLLAGCAQSTDQEEQKTRTEVAGRAAKWLMDDGYCPVSDAPRPQCERLLQARMLLALDSARDSALKRFLDRHIPRVDGTPNSLFFEGGFTLAGVGIPSIEFASGLSHNEAQYRWSDERVVRFGFRKPLPTPLTLKFRAHAFGPNSRFSSFWATNGAWLISRLSHRILLSSSLIRIGCG